MCFERDIDALINPKIQYTYSLVVNVLYILALSWSPIRSRCMWVAGFNPEILLFSGKFTENVKFD